MPRREAKTGGTAGTGALVDTKTDLRSHKKVTKRKRNYCLANYP